MLLVNVFVNTQNWLTHHAVTPNCFKTNHRALTRPQYIQKKLRKKLYPVRQFIQRTKNLVRPQRIPVNLRCTIIQKIIVLKTEAVLR